MTITTFGSQIVAAVALLVSTFLIGTLPSTIMFKNSTQLAQHKASFMARLLSFLSTYGGGILFATSLVHMLPEVRESLEHWPEKFKKISINLTTGQVNSTGEGHDNLAHYPLAELLVGVGFFLVYFVEELVHLCVAHSHSHAHDKMNVIDKQARAKHRKLEQFKRDHADFHAVQSAPTTRNNSQTNLANHASCEREQLADAIVCQTGTNYGSILCRSDQISTSQVDLKSHDHNHIEANGHGHSHATGGVDMSMKSPHDVFRCLLIIVALSFHSIFDGLAIGLQETTANVWQLFMAIALHKLLIAFVVGLDIFSETKSIKRVAIYMAPFSLMSPLGVVIAMVAKVNISKVASGALSALSTGSLLYITFYEILLRERTTSKLSGVLQCLALVLGFATMAIVQAFSSHSH